RPMRPRSSGPGFLALKSIGGQPDEHEPCDPNTCRVDPVSESVKRVMSLQRKLGITRIADLTSYDVLGIPVAGVTRPPVHSSDITASSGKGMTWLEALASALFEAVEWHAASSVTDLHTETLEELIRRGEFHCAPTELGGRAIELEPIEWVRCVHVASGDSYML